VPRAERWQDARFHLLIFDGLDASRALTGDVLTEHSRRVLAELSLDVTVHQIAHFEREAHELFGTRVPMFALLRPDGHLMFRGQHELDMRSLQRLLNRTFAKRDPSRTRSSLPEHIPSHSS
jgi:hypothetical protein